MVIAGLSGPDVDIGRHTLGVTHTSHTDSHTRHLRVPGTSIQVTVFAVTHARTILMTFSQEVSLRKTRPDVAEVC